MQAVYIECVNSLRVHLPSGWLYISIICVFYLDFPIPAIILDQLSICCYSILSPLLAY